MRGLAMVGTAVLAALGLGLGALAATGGTTSAGKKSPSAALVDASTQRPVEFGSVAWRGITIPGSWCGAPHTIRLRGGQATIPASAANAGQRALVRLQLVRYGRLRAGEPPVAALNVWCDNGGGTADGQIANVWVIFAAQSSKASLVGLVTTQQPARAANSVHTAYFNELAGGLRFGDGRLVATELWYGTRDGTCCPSGRASSTWSESRGHLRHVSTTVTRPPVR
jgi:hypothetical protein